MFIIFGIKRKEHRLATISAICAFCHTHSAQVLMSVRAFFNLFFVPVIPLGTRYRTTCTMCGTTTVVSAESADRLMAAAPEHTRPVRDIQVAAPVA